MNRTTEWQPDALTEDDILLGSLSYQGFSSRFEMWILLMVKLAATLLLVLLSTLGTILSLLFYVLCVWPLYVRRARQMGAAGYGLFIVVLCALFLLTGMMLLLLGHREELSRLSEWAALIVVLQIPLYIYGGPYSGRKSALMRAAMEGDLVQVRQLVEQHPLSIWNSSEKGFTPRQFAEKRGHRAVADYLRAREEEAWTDTRSLPTATDISPYDTLDELKAKQHFLGKNRLQAAWLFFDHATVYSEDIFWMGDTAFCYYLSAMSPYLESTASEHDDVFINSLLLAIEWRLEQSPQAIQACRDDVLHLLRYLGDNLTKFDLGAEGDSFYHDLPAKAARLLAQVEAMNEAHP